MLEIVRIVILKYIFIEDNISSFFSISWLDLTDTIILQAAAGDDEKLSQEDFK